MDNRLVAVAAVALAAGAAGCSTPPAALGGTTAKVTINGQSTGGPHPVRCTQSGWSWRIATPTEAKGFTANINTGDEVVVNSVDFRDFGGFTGTFWQDHLGEAEVTSAGGKYTITGSADGSFADNPSNEATATFRIEADC
ncbi:lipoprotein LpqH [Mycobacterium sp. IDR2000157661]|uniref:lipoprotein LpqH n=1 Tax=Mycobacterium sp. IDR2000157661 TaxID=2867005 RepID=UPI001EE9DF1F|nr:lipoprotein LpqH [Mycobacterium sp. IDR2000157661]ULE32350.1 lipoprotein LpqH [Mycobacterium sp. IDR2000157661]